MFFELSSERYLSYTLCIIYNSWYLRQWFSSKCKSAFEIVLSCSNNWQRLKENMKPLLGKCTLQRLSQFIQGILGLLKFFNSSCLVRAREASLLISSQYLGCSWLRTWFFSSWSTRNLYSSSLLTELRGTKGQAAPTRNKGFSSLAATF